MLTEKQVLKVIKSKNLTGYQKRNKRFKKSNGKFIFDPYNIEAYSYSWWKFVAKVKGKVVFNDYSYSKTTNGHQSRCRGLMEDLGIKIDAFISTSTGLQSSNWKLEALIPVYEQLLKLELFGHRRRYFITYTRNYERIKNKYTPEMLKNEIKEVRQKIKLLRSLGAVFTRDQIKELKKNMIEDDKTRLAEAKEKRKQVAEQKRALKPLLNDLQGVNFLNREINDTNVVPFRPTNN